MPRFVLVRLLQAVVVLWGAATLFFLASRVLPGDPIRALFGFASPPAEELARLRARYRLDDPLVVQYLDHLWKLARGHLGSSYYFGPIGPLVSRALESTLRLMALALVGQVGFGLGFGVTARVVRTRLGRVATRFVAILGASVPVVVTATIIDVVVGPVASGTTSIAAVDAWLPHLWPAVILTLSFGSYVALTTDDALREAIHAPWFAAARARGLRRSRLMWLHALKPSLGPIVTLIGANVAQFVSAVVVVEAILGPGGLGALTFDAIRRRDHDIIIAVGIVSTVIVVIVTIITDILVAALDPRIRDS